jgi:hypothetical protein
LYTHGAIDEDGDGTVRKPVDDILLVFLFHTVPDCFGGDLLVLKVSLEGSDMLD